ncbi:hypothetical protein MTO96_050539 [Rhipicephalus appendiculatus]
MTLPVITYVPAPDDSIRGVIYKAYTDESDEYLQAELTKKNSDIPIVNARRLGSSRHLVITFAGHTLPATIRFRCFTLEVHPFRERPEACFNCRKLGHRTDVCPLPGPGIPKCRRCGGEHLPPPLGEKPTCTPQCVVCLGEHPTGSRSCKLRFTPVKHHNSRKSMSCSTNEEGRSKSPGHRSRSRTRKGSKSRNTQAASPAQTSRSPSQETSARMSTVNNYKNAWSNGPPKSVGWSTDDPGQSSKAVTTQPASNTKQGGQGQEPVNVPDPRRPLPDPVRHQGCSHRLSLKTIR